MIVQRVLCIAVLLAAPNLHIVENNAETIRVSDHRARIPSPFPLRVAKTGRNHLNEELTPLLPPGLGERF